MMVNMPETMINKKVTYTNNYEGKFYIMENVPARVCVHINLRLYCLITGRYIIFFYEVSNNA
ncbi:MAG: YgiT-type zinc finger protein [Gammaproteobacteria bacterium]|nr:YgiT-type zinc finger protein [Gammaproteobacteria bacterium]